MKTRIILCAAFATALSLAGVAHAQNTTTQQNAQPAATTSTTTEYGGVSGSSTAMGGSTRAGWVQSSSCNYLPRCAPNSGH
ncbi:hypothetical protein [Burkholderia sp. Ac-20365]|uniref:hypothetical protein n=1 Tax=Burkholderia sp. Ac-20365 TaxID=2703897 RepID=UPI00197C3F96|nr:hypothetical protein [Burkholderia sp. Ac-20365]MBN3763755.1 hypothetical protein [Burkholderia sp. Ac-20365]